MCGLFGIAVLGRGALFPESEISRARTARDTLSHRGPDQVGETIAGPVYMGHRRLSILDLSDAGRQPMISEDDAVTITVNGEIYNFKTLRAELEKAGFHFQSTSDSEVVLHGYRHWGANILAERMDGMYVAIIHDQTKETITIIRDRTGIKPLFYFYDGKHFAWASEAKALLNWAGNKCPVNPEALYDFLTYLYIPSPKSAWKNIFKVQPANILTLDLPTGKIKTRRYWDIDHTIKSGSDQDLADEILTLVQQSVKDQLVSDVPVGFFLSGGMDSTALLYHGAKLHPGIQSFSIGFDDENHNETGYAKIAANAYNTPHHVKILHAGEAEDIFRRTLDWYDEPFSDTGALPAYHLCEFARQSVTVAIGGDGGDELFCGYHRYSQFLRLRKLQKKIPLGSARGLPLGSTIGFRRNLGLLTTRDPLQLYSVLRGGLGWHEKAKYRREFDIPEDYDDLWHFRPWWRTDLPDLRRMQYLDLMTYLPENIFTKLDRLSMAVSLEARVPFLSRTLMEFVFSLPESFTYKNSALKGGMKFAYAPHIPQAILNRPKKGFSMPVKSWNTLKPGVTYPEMLLQTFMDGKSA